MNPLDPVDVVQAQLDAYNRRDVEAFIALFDEEATAFELGAATPTLSGRDQICERYRALFERSPALHSHLVSRTAFGRAVIDLERVTGREGSSDIVEVLVIYEVVASKIRRMHFVRPG